VDTPAHYVHSEKICGLFYVKADKGFMKENFLKIATEDKVDKIVLSEVLRIGGFFFFSDLFHSPFNMLSSSIP